MNVKKQKETTKKKKTRGRRIVAVVRVLLCLVLVAVVAVSLSLGVSTRALRALVFARESLTDRPELVAVEHERLKEPALGLDDRCTIGKGDDEIGSLELDFLDLGRRFVICAASRR